MSKHQEKPTSAVFIALFFYQAGFTSIIGKSNMYTDVVATVGVCGFLWHCLAPLASQLLLHPRQQKWKKGKRAETGFSIKNHSKISSNFGGDKLIHKRLEWCFFFPLESVDQFQSFRAQVIEIPGGLLAGQYYPGVLQLPGALRIIAVAHVWESKEHRNIGTSRSPRLLTSMFFW